MKNLRHDITLIAILASSQLALAGAGASGEAMAEAAEEGGGIFGAILMFGTIWVVGTVWQKIRDANEEAKQKRKEALRKKAYMIEKKIKSYIQLSIETEKEHRYIYSLPSLPFGASCLTSPRKIFNATYRAKSLYTNSKWLISAVNGYLDAENNSNRLKPEYDGSLSKFYYAEYGKKTKTRDWEEYDILMDGYECGKSAHFVYAR